MCVCVCVCVCVYVLNRLHPKTTARSSHSIFAYHCTVSVRYLELRLGF